MISKISRIKNLGLVFQDYTRRSDLPVFKQTNLIYGWNGTGKTTLSRLFDAVSGLPIDSLEYEVEGATGGRYKNGETYNQKIRVFNQDYILNNVKILDSRANTISVLLGEENKELVEKIEDGRKLLFGNPDNPTIKGKASLRDEATKSASRKSVERGGKFTTIAQTIGAAIGGNALRDYRKPQAERDFALITEKSELSEADLNEYSTKAKQESLPVIELVALKKVELDGEDSMEAAVLLEQASTEAAALLNKTVESETIARLASNEDIADWVEEGISLHKKHKASECEFCGQTIPENRLRELSKHFNDADKELKQDIDIQVAELKSIYSAIQDISTPDKARLYAALQDNFDKQVPSFETAKKEVLDGITKLAEELKNKKSKTTEVVKLTEQPTITNLLSEIVSLNNVIKTHNKTTDDFEDVKKEAIDKVKTHYLSTISDEVKKLDGEVAQDEEDSKVLAAEIIVIEKDIEDAMAQISSDHKACEVINEKLSIFLGHQELRFVPHIEKEIAEDGTEKETSKGYDIMRGESLAIKLSEGEKTAIAFVYFVVHLDDQEFDVNTGIIVIDDPVSSLDSNSLYQAFSFLKNAVKDAEQVFILTHNFDFLKLLISWRRNAGGTTTGYFMIKNSFPAEIRCATIEKMDKELCDYESEYHYLFKLLKELRDNQDDSIAKAYPIPNIARKVWDTFTTFSVPNGKSQYQKMEELKQLGYDEVKLDAIYKFINDQSHITGSGFDPALVVGTKKAVSELFDMIKEISPEHYRIIDEATQ